MLLRYTAGRCLAAGGWMLNRVLMGVLLGFGVMPLALAQGEAPAASKSVDELRACASANAPSESFSQNAKFVTTDAEGATRTLETRLYGRSEDGKLRLTLHVRQPPDVSGTALLIRREDGDDDMFMYLPALRKSRRVTGAMTSSKVLGTDFSYADIQRLFGTLSTGTATALPDGTLEEQPVHQVQLEPQIIDGGDPVRVVAALEQAHCVPLRVSFYDETGTVIRQLDADVSSIQAVGSHHLATQFVMQDKVVGSTTELTLSKVEFDERIPISLFNPRGYFNPR